MLFHKGMSQKSKMKIYAFISDNLWYLPSKEEAIYTFKTDELNYYTAYVTKAAIYKIRFYQSTLVKIIPKEKFTSETKKKVKNKEAHFYERMEDGNVGIYEIKYVNEKKSWSQPDINSPQKVLEMINWFTN